MFDKGELCNAVLKNQGLEFRKVISIEGGAVCFSDSEFRYRIARLKNFGFRVSETVEGVWANAKMNEFCAAMGISVVLPGVTIANGSAFGSFSFINHNSEEWSINAGIPFRKINDRRREAEKMERQLMYESGLEGEMT